MAHQKNANTTNSTTKRSFVSRKLIGAWVMGGGIWVLGMFGLLVAPVTADVSTSTTVKSDYYAHAGTWQTYTDASGKYTVVIRGLVSVRGL